MENKYYTPDLSELHIGYETNFISGKGLDKTDNIKRVTITTDNIKTIERDISLVNTKYLDSSDIISLGFEQLDTIDVLFGKNSYLYKVPKNPEILHEMDGYTTRLLLKHEQGKIRIEKQMFGGMSGLEENYEQVYYGPCKSKNELKTILSWIK